MKSYLLNQNMDQFMDTVIKCNCDEGCNRCNNGKILLTEQNVYVYQQMLKISIENLSGLEQKQLDVQKSIQIFDINQQKDKPLNL